MAIAQTFRIDIRPYFGYDSPTLPIAAWIGQAGIVGDASGGNIIFDFVFQDTDGPQISELFNFEQLSMDISSSAQNRDISIETVNMDSLSRNRPASEQRWQTLVSAVSGTANTELQPGWILPLWLGAPSRFEGLSSLRFVTVNVDLLFYAITVQGYMWGPRSMLAPGGPQRPVGAMFGG